MYTKNKLEGGGWARHAPPMISIRASLMLIVLQVSNRCHVSYNLQKGLISKNIFVISSLLHDF
jgi:hypothetical protein